MQPDNLSENSQLYRFLAENGAVNVGPYEFQGMQSMCSSSLYQICPLEGSVITDTSHMTPQDRAIAALKNHKEAEKRRRERINSHLDKLRTLLPCNSKEIPNHSENLDQHNPLMTLLVPPSVGHRKPLNIQTARKALSAKTDKASLLAKVVQQVRELKQQASQIPCLDSFPSETDEITVLSSEYSSDGQLIFKASLCCEDRSELLPDLIESLKSLHLKTLRAEMVTLGGRIRNVLIVAADKDHSVESVHFLQNALKSILERSNSGDRSKRRRVLDGKLINQ